MLRIYVQSFTLPGQDSKCCLRHVKNICHHQNLQQKQDSVASKIKFESAMIIRGSNSAMPLQADKGYSNGFVIIEHNMKDCYSYQYINQLRKWKSQIYIIKANTHYRALCYVTSNDRSSLNTLNRSSKKSTLIR